MHCLGRSADSRAALPVALMPLALTLLAQHFAAALAIGLAAAAAPIPLVPTWPWSWSTLPVWGSGQGSSDFSADATQLLARYPVSWTQGQQLPGACAALGAACPWEDCSGGMGDWKNCPPLGQASLEAGVFPHVQTDGGALAWDWCFPHARRTAVIRMALPITERLLWRCGDHPAKPESASKICSFLWHMGRGVGVGVGAGGRGCGPMEWNPNTQKQAPGDSHSRDGFPPAGSQSTAQLLLLNCKLQAVSFSFSNSGNCLLGRQLSVTESRLA